VRRGGAAVAVYSISDDTTLDGVRVGDAFFPGYPLPGRAPADVATTGSWRAAIFAVPVEGAKNPDVDVVAADAAGNESVVGFPARIRERSFPLDEIRLSERFLEKVPPPLARESELEGNTPLETFQRVNRELRARNEVRIREIVAGSGSQVQWRGAFEQMTNTIATSLFAELRSYTVAKDGGERRVVSSARHYGFDLASTAHAAVTAANGGSVLYAGPLGIYGNTVVLDHGLGLTSLYGHLSNIAVEQGQRVARGGELGRSGKTGLAGGDHLHFAILVAQTYVDPLEWWDAKWIAAQVETPLGIAAEVRDDSVDASF
jgi:murein DD-endopeptidase MepM/ murein hydrolase activator NlpD